MKIHLHSLTLLILCLILAACGSGAGTEAETEEAEDYTGRYYLVERDHRTLSTFNENMLLRLKDDGEAALRENDEESPIQWRVSGKNLTLTLNGEKVKGTIEDGTISIRLYGRDSVYVKGKNAAQRYIETSVSTDPVGTAVATEAATEQTTLPEPASSAETAQTDPSADTNPAPQTQPVPGFDPDVRFSGTDQYGKTIDETVFRDHVITMINFWEPWCGPCVGEMPELDQLYRDRNGELLILGVYWTEDGAAEVLSQTGISYPVILFDDVFARYQSGYVPTTIFVDSAGHVIGSPYIGSRSYADWDQIIKGMIGH